MGYIGGWYYGELIRPTIRLHQHPIAQAVPKLSHGDFTGLRLSIKERGLIDPITRLRGWLYGQELDPIVDGWHRYLACLMEGVPLRFEYKDLTDDAAVVAFVLSRNVNRRHLDESLRAMLAARLGGWKLGDNQHSGLENLPTLAEVAARFNVSIKSVQFARKVLNNGAPELIRAVEACRVTVSLAARLAKLPKEEQIPRLGFIENRQVRLGTCAAEYGWVPTTVLDTRSKDWQDRKTGWLALGIKSEEGRGENVLGYSDSLLTMQPTGDFSGTSVFDPVVCELMYHWYCPAGGLILDPFAGGSVRGLVAAHLGYHYTGVDVRPEQIAANKAQAERLRPEGMFDRNHWPQWIAGDSRDLDQLVEAESADLVFSCPPYSGVERYSDDECDLSTMKWDEYISSFEQIIAKSIAALKPNRFAIFVMGEARENGALKGLVPETIRLFQKAGATYHQEAILITPVGSWTIRIRPFFDGRRTLARTHQYVLVFCKGDPAKAAAACDGTKLPPAKSNDTRLAS